MDELLAVAVKDHQRKNLRERAFRGIDLLRIQDNVACQAIVQVRNKSTRAYVVKSKILEWKSGEAYKSYNPATNIRALPVRLTLKPRPFLNSIALGE
jgi:hypothetical protein